MIRGVASHFDKTLIKGFINKNELLKNISQEQIFELVFGFEPIENQYVISPFRNDNNPGCFFKYYNNELKFIDFANFDIIEGIKMNNINCFNAVKIYYKLNNFYETLKFIKKKIKDKKIKKKINFVKKEKVKIDIKIRNYNNKDKRYWNKFGITINNLKEDKVFPIRNYSLYNTKKGDFINTNVNTLVYVFTGFKEKRKKLYFPLNKKFIGNCNKNDIGEINSLIDFGELLIISKSYKDCRVIKNQGYNSVWFQNEGMIPNYEIIILLCKRFKHIIIFFDNDNAGIKAGNVLNNFINSLYPKKSKFLHLPLHYLNKYNVKDPADMYYIMGFEKLKLFLENNTQNL